VSRLGDRRRLQSVRPRVVQQRGCQRRKPPFVHKTHGGICVSYLPRSRLLKLYYFALVDLEEVQSACAPSWSGILWLSENYAREKFPC